MLGEHLGPHGTHPTPKGPAVTTIEARDQHIAAAELALNPVVDILRIWRMGSTTVNVNPLLVQVALEYAKIQALLAIAAGGTLVPGELLEAGDALAPVTPLIPQPAPTNNNGGLVVP